MAIFEIPTSLELRRVEQVLLPKRTATSPFFRYFPFEFKNEWVLRWAQRDNNKGLQQVRGLGGKPNRVAMVGDKTYLAEPGVYGEFIELDERELTQRRNAAELSGGPIPIRDMIKEAFGILLDRRLNRIEYILSRLVCAGTFSVSESNGSVVHTDSYTQTSYAAPVAWNTVATSAPLADFRAINVLFRGQSASGGRTAKCLMNQVTANWMMKCQNANDLGGRRVNGGSTLNDLADINRIFLDNNLPQVEVYEGGYYDESGTFQLHIADGEGVVIGSRDNGDPIGSYRYTMNLQSMGGKAGSYSKVIDRTEDQVPGSIEVHDGHNGGPTLFYPGCIIKMTNLIA